MSDFLVGSAIIFGFILLYGAGLEAIARALKHRFKNEAEHARYWGMAFGAWSILVAVVFSLVSETEIGSPVGKLGPLVLGVGILMGVAAFLTKWRAPED